MIFQLLDGAMGSRFFSCWLERWEFAVAAAAGLIARGVGVVLQLLHGAPGRAAPFSAVGGILTLPRLHMRSHSA